MNRPDQIASLSELPGLTDWCNEQGFCIKDVGPHEIEIADQENGSIWSLYRVEAWLQIKGLVFDDTSPSQALCLSLARLHSRLLGCRFGIDEENNLLLHADVFPHDQSGTAVGAAIIQMQWIVDATYGLLRRVQDSGVPGDDVAIDEAFQLGLPALH